MAITAIGPTGTVDQAGFSKLADLGDGMVGSLPGSANLRVDRVAGADRRVTVQPGDAKVPGIRSTNTTTATYDFPANTSGSPRLDWLVKRYSWSASPATVSIVHVQGTPSTSPARPALVQIPGDRWELPLALIRVNAGVGAFPADAVIDARYWDVDGVAVMPARTVDPLPRPGRLLYVVGDGELLISGTTAYQPVAPAVVSALITMPGTWGIYGAGYGAPVARAQNGIITLGGLIRRTGPSFYIDDTLAGPIATVPAGYRPSVTRVFVVPSKIGPMQLRIAPDGDVLISRELYLPDEIDSTAFFPTSTGWVGLDGVSYLL